MKVIFFLVNVGLVWSLYMKQDNKTNIHSFGVSDNEWLLFGEAQRYASTTKQVVHIEADLAIADNILYLESNQLVTSNATTSITVSHSLSAFNAINAFLQLDDSDIIILENSCLKTFNRSNNHIHYFVGSCNYKGCVDGSFQQARFFGELHYIVRHTKRQNELYISDIMNNAVRMVNLKAQSVFTIKKSPTELSLPRSLAWHGTENDLLYVHIANSIVTLDVNTGEIVQVFEDFSRDYLSFVVVKASALIFAQRTAVLTIQDANFSKPEHICKKNFHDDAFESGSATECKLNQPQTLLLLNETLFIGCRHGIITMPVQLVANESGEATPALTEDDDEADSEAGLKVACFLMTLFCMLVLLVTLYKFLRMLWSCLVLVRGKIYVKYRNRRRKMASTEMNSTTLAQIFGLVGREKCIYLKGSDARIYLQRPDGTFPIFRVGQTYSLKLLPIIAARRTTNANASGENRVTIVNEDKLRKTLQGLNRALLDGLQCPMCLKIATKPKFMKCCGRIGGCSPCFKRLMQDSLGGEGCPVCTARFVHKFMGNLHYGKLRGLDTLITLTARGNGAQGEKPDSPLLTSQDVNQLVMQAQKAFRCSVCGQTATPPICFLSNCSHISGCIRCFNNYWSSSDVSLYCGVCHRKTDRRSLFIVKGLDKVLDALHTLEHLDFSCPTSNGVENKICVS